ncbi:MAG: DUF6470 family protein [Alicyclobacillus sp.]|nr:DUF6470 family protein [Alicyclobacillus sp.]
MIPQIQIVQQWGQIGLAYTPMQWYIKQPPAEWQVHAPPAQLEIHITPGQLTIDQTEAFADEDLRTPLAFLQHEAQLAWQTAEQGTAEAADWGQRFLHIEKGDALAQWVMRYRDKQPQVVPALVPRPFSVHIHYQPGRVQIHADVQPVRVQETLPPVQVVMTYGKVQTYLAKPPFLYIIAPHLGQRIDLHV